MSSEKAPLQTFRPTIAPVNHGGLTMVPDPHGRWVPLPAAELLRDRVDELGNLLSAANEQHEEMGETLQETSAAYEERIRALEAENELIRAELAALNVPSGVAALNRDLRAENAKLKLYADRYLALVADPSDADKLNQLIVDQLAASRAREMTEERIERAAANAVRDISLDRVLYPAERDAIKRQIASAIREEMETPTTHDEGRAL